MADEISDEDLVAEAMEARHERLTRPQSDKASDPLKRIARDVAVIRTVVVLAFVLGVLGAALAYVAAVTAA